MKKKSTFDRNDIYVKLTDSFINLLNQGIIPWQRPWTPSTGPANMISKNPYRGSNVWLLNAIQEIKGYKSRWWMTFKQASELGGNVRKGEKGTMVVFWQFNKYQKEKADGTISEKVIPFIRYSTVFNLEQCENIPVEKIPVQEKNDIGTVEELEEILENWETKPDVHVGGDRASYIPAFDIVKMPKKEDFKTTAGYYSVLCHEFMHSTGAKHRLGREGITNLSLFGSHNYAKEELVAEMGASFMLGIAGLDRETHKNNAAYIQSWIKALKNDPKMIVQAGSEAQKAVEYILNGGEIKEKTAIEGEETEVAELETA